MSLGTAVGVGIGVVVGLGMSVGTGVGVGTGVVVGVGAKRAELMLVGIGVLLSDKEQAAMIREAMTAATDKERGILASC